MMRIAQLLLVAGAAMLWGASRLPWVQVSSSDGLGQPKTTTLVGATWSTALIPLALLLLAAAVAALAVRGWALRVLALLMAAASAGMGYLAVSLWVITDVAVRAAHLADFPVAQLTGTVQRYSAGATLALVAALCALAAAVLLMRSATKGRAATTRYAAPATRKSTVVLDGEPLSERTMWDALDAGHDPTGELPEQDNKGR